MANFTKSLDPNRPITAAIAVPVNDDKAVCLMQLCNFIAVILWKSASNKMHSFWQAQFLDIISFNRYNGWYSNPGRLEMITSRVVDEAISWNAKHQKPVLMSEYGADTVEGLHFVCWFYKMIWNEKKTEPIYYKWLLSNSCQRLCGQKSISASYFRGISKHLILYGIMDGLLANLFGILLTSKRIKVKIFLEIENIRHSLKQYAASFQHI